eukprot:scaffold24741_cov53-Attheya_sp.AAC.3
MNVKVKRAKQKWAMIARVLSRDQALPRTAGIFHKAIVQMVLASFVQFGILGGDSTDAPAGGCSPVSTITPGTNNAPFFTIIWKL